MKISTAQDIVDQLYTDNQQVNDEKQSLEAVCTRQNDKIENLRLQVENLKYLLLTGFDIGHEKSNEREQKLFWALKNAHDELDDLKTR